MYPPLCCYLMCVFRFVFACLCQQARECVVEYATPLLTLYKMSQESSAGFGEPERRQQVLLFFRTLQNILEQSLECRNRYTLILLNGQGAAKCVSVCVCVSCHTMWDRLLLGAFQFLAFLLTLHKDWQSGIGCLWCMTKIKNKGQECLSLWLLWESQFQSSLL